MIRKARKEDAKEIAPLIMVILKDMELPLLNKISEEELLLILEKGIQDETYRYSYNHIHVCEREGRLAGFVAGYPGRLEDKIDLPLNDIVSDLGFDPLTERLFEDKETFAGEWYLDSIVTKEEFRGMGVGTELLEALGMIAKETGETTIGLSCDKNNPHAKRLYERMGFKATNEVMLSGHCYDHMQKKVI